MKLYAVTVDKIIKLHVPVVADNEESAIEYVNNNKDCIQEMIYNHYEFCNCDRVASACVVTKDSIPWDEDIIVFATNDGYIDASISEVLCESVMPNPDDSDAWKIYEKCKKDIIDNMKKST